MDSILDARVQWFLRERHGYGLHEAATLTIKIKALAEASGSSYAPEFGTRGLGAGPEGRIASQIVDMAMLGDGSACSEYEIKKHCDDWLHTMQLTHASST